MPLPEGGQTVELDALAAGYRSSIGRLGRAGDRASVTLSPGGTGTYDFKLPEALYLKGVVMDEAGQPVRNAEIEATCTTADGGYGNVAQTRTTADGQFEVFDFPLLPGKGWTAGRLTVRHGDYISSAVGNVYSLSKEEQAQLKLVLAKGKALTGTLLDASGKNPFPETFLGDAQWKDHSVSVNALVEKAGFVSLFGRVGRIEQNGNPPWGFWLKVDTSGAWELAVRREKVPLPGPKPKKEGEQVLLASGVVATFAPDQWHPMKLVFQGTHVTAFIDDAKVADVTSDLAPMGMAGIGSGWHGAQFQHFRIDPLP